MGYILLSQQRLVKLFISLTVTDGQRLRRDKVLLVPHDTVMTTEKNVIKVATKQQKDNELFKIVNLKK
jgi:hypothetical protein